MDPAIVGLLILGIAVFSVGMLSAHNIAKHRSQTSAHPQESVSTRNTGNDSRNVSENPIELAAVGAGQGEISNAEKRDMLTRTGH
jgi:hypothetical protein